MLSSFTWGDYFETLLYVLPLYYGYVLIVYYREELKSLMGGRTFSMLSLHKGPSTESATDTEKPVFHQEGSHTALIHHIRDELTAFLSAAGQNRFAKEDILLSLQHLLQKYPLVNGSPYQHPVEEWIIVHCQRECDIKLSRPELEILWQTEVVV